MENGVKKIYDFIVKDMNNPLYNDNGYAERWHGQQAILDFIKENFDVETYCPRSCNNCKNKKLYNGKLICYCCSYDDYKYCCEEIPKNKREIIAKTCEDYEREE
jgi:hypothetical protein